MILFNSDDECMMVLLNSTERKAALSLIAESPCVRTRVGRRERGYLCGGAEGCRGGAGRR